MQTCQGCGRTAPAGVMFCDGCGGRLGAPGAAGLARWRNRRPMRAWSGARLPSTRAIASMAGAAMLVLLVTLSARAVDQGGTSPVAGAVDTIDMVIGAVCTVLILLCFLLAGGLFLVGRTGAAFLLLVAAIVIPTLIPYWDPSLVSGPLGRLVSSIGVVLIMLCGLRVMMGGIFPRRRRR